ncbi:hypothetical protein GCM10022222_02620 [Amycolatopsis ultiminotia]|uniref:GerMN domain-containing protein n=1 Tax=Amycolatopsis ultiminotia TaxID=543629 RepID=A0ABP6UX45_9PSEU
MIRRAGCALAVVALLAAGCGVRPSGVIQGLEAPSGPPVPSAGGHGTGAPSSPPAAVSLYFVSGGSVVPVTRPEVATAPAGLLTLLAGGPDESERANGLTTEVPRTIAPATVTTSGTTVEAMLGTDVTALSPTAVNQIVCTLLAANSLADAGTALLRSGGHSLHAHSCAG